MSFLRAFRRPMSRGRGALSVGLALAAGSAVVLTASAFGQYPCNNACPPTSPGMYYGGAAPAPGYPMAPAYPAAPGAMMYAQQMPYSGPVQPGQEVPTMPGAAPIFPSPQAAAPEAAVSPDMLAGAPGAGFGGAPATAAPTMIGDFIGSGGFAGDFFHSHGAPAGQVSIAGGDRRFKIGENQSPIPTDRIYASYHHFHNPLLLIDPLGRVADVNFDRVTAGLEKTFCSGMMSLEARVPFGRGLDSDQSGDVFGNFRATEFGNVVVIGKSYLLRSCCWSLTGGVGVSIPTADDARYFDDTGLLVSEIENDSYHIQPFLGMLWTPNDRLFFESFVAADFDANGYEVLVGESILGPDTRQKVGTYNDQSLLIVDLKLGYWLLRNPHCSHGCIAGVAPTVEVHYTSTMQEADEVFFGSQTVISDPLNRWENVNLTAGLQFLLWNESILTVYGVAPLHEDDAPLEGFDATVSSNFDAEFGVQFNCYF